MLRVWYAKHDRDASVDETEACNIPRLPQSLAAPTDYFEEHQRPFMSFRPTRLSSSNPFVPCRDSGSDLLIFPGAVDMASFCDARVNGGRAWSVSCLGRF